MDREEKIKKIARYYAEKMSLSELIESFIDSEIEYMRDYSDKYIDNRYKEMEEEKNEKTN